LPEEFTTKIKTFGKCKNNIKMNLDQINKANNQINDLINILKNEYSVDVIRPNSINHDISIKTPYWSITNMNENTCPRDVFSIIGNTILEAPVSWRCRYFESLAYHEPLMKIWKCDKKNSMDSSTKTIIER
jgi:glycine amidinotransferase